jgi:alpha-mannosidase
MGGYAEAREPFGIVDYIDTDPTFLSHYGYRVAGAFGKGWDDLQTTTDDIITAAQTKTTAGRQVYVSNMLDFFADVEATYGAQLPSAGASYGNEWDLLVASMSEVSAGIKRALAKLRAAEAMATLVALKSPAFLNGRQAARDKAMIDFGLYFEHNWTADGPVTRADRAAWQRRIANEIHSYVDTLYSDAATALAGQIVRSGTAQRFFVFNPLGWTRTDLAEIAYSGQGPLRVVDITTGAEVPSQLATVGGIQRLQVLAPNVPAAGYKVFEILAGAGQTWSPAATVTSGSIVENSIYRVTVSGRGAITSWVDKTRGNRELAQANNGYVVNDLGSGTGTIQIEQAGPVSVTLVATASTPVAHTTRVTIVRDSHRVAIENRITQNFGSVQSWRFSFNQPTPEIRHEEVGAVVAAKLASQGGQYAARNARYDWLTLNHFVDLTGSDDIGVTLSNADLYFMQVGNSTPSTLDTSTALVKVLAGGQIDGPNLGIPNQGGDTSFLQRFALQSHDAFDSSAAMAFALEHQNPFVTRVVTGGTFYPATSYSFLTVSDPGTLLWALKPADDGIDQGVVLRLWNLKGTPTTPLVRLPSGVVQSASRLSHIETFEESATVQNGALVASLAGKQLRTYAIRPAGGIPPPAPPGNVRIIR